ncbi:TPA: S6 family peptidase, partial [Escherichia coli]
MNRIYSLKYSHITKGLIAVSELTKKAIKTGGKRKKHFLLISFLSPVFFYNSSINASIVSANIPYQTFRDFAENKGEFAPGSMNIAIYDKQGNKIGSLDKAPMIDFSSVNIRNAAGVATLVNP